MAAPSLTFRPMRESDLAAALLVRTAASEELRRREGQTVVPGAPPQRPLLQRHLMQRDPGGSWVAEVNEVVVGYAQAYVRGDIWYLSQFFVMPSAQSLGAGGGVLDRAFAYGRERGARINAVTSSQSTVAHALYARCGMYARGLGYALSGPVEPLRALPSIASDRERFDAYAGHEADFARLDAAVWGAERRPEHEVFAAGGFADEEACFGVMRKDELRGYGYVMDDGWIGPIAAYEPASQLELLRIAADWLSERGIADARCYCCSLNPTLMDAFLRAGWRINHWSFLMSSAPFGQFDRYLASGGLLL
jgi:ribosomal protein S18 acetylase RimI-like enzyme